MSEPLWLTLARELIGLGEIVGTKHEPKVVKFFADAGVPEISNDETAWCGAFVASMFVKAGRRDVRPPGDRYNALRAREWLKVGQEVRDPLPGDLVIFTREGGGHVAFYVGETATQIKVLGGNQSNSVSVQNYPKSRLLGFRRVAQTQKPAPAPIQPPRPIESVRPSQTITGPIRQPDDPGVEPGEKPAPMGRWQSIVFAFKALFRLKKEWPGR